MRQEIENAEPISRKEIFDYLRNVQKETEVKARLSGINVWVLYGAIGFLLWKLLSINSYPLYLLHWITFCCEVLSVGAVILIILSVGSDESDIRFRPAGVNSRNNLSKYWCMRFAWFGAPFIFSAIAMGVTVSAAVMIVITFVLIFIELFVKIDNEDVNMLTHRTLKERLIGVIVYTAIMAFTILENFRSLSGTARSLVTSDLKVIILSVSIYFLIILLIKRGLTDNSDAWSYDLEKKLLLGLCSNSEALWVIESQQLGSRLVKVVEKKRADVSSSLEQLSSLLEGANHKINEIAKISIEYAHERKAQYDEVSGPFKEAIDKSEQSIKRLSDFAKKLVAKNEKIKDEQIESLGRELTKDISSFQAKLDGFRRMVRHFEVVIFPK